MFQLDPAFDALSRQLASLPLCEVRLQLDARYPWLILIPRVEAVRELEDLPSSERSCLMGELLLAGAAVRAMGAALGRPVAKLNIGILGNVTPQLHAHVVGRRPDDPAWPGPVWGQGKPASYGSADLERVSAAAFAALVNASRE